MYMQSRCGHFELSATGPLQSSNSCRDIYELGEAITTELDCCLFAGERDDVLSMYMRRSTSISSCGSVQTDDRILTRLHYQANNNDPTGVGELDRRDCMRPRLCSRRKIGDLSLLVRSMINSHANRAFYPTHFDLLNLFFCLHLQPLDRLQYWDQLVIGNCVQCVAMSDDFRSSL